MDGWGESVRVCSGGEGRGTFESAGCEGRRKRRKENVRQERRKERGRRNAGKGQVIYYLWINKGIINY